MEEEGVGHWLSFVLGRDMGFRVHWREEHLVDNGDDFETFGLQTKFWSQDLILGSWHDMGSEVL